jgi:uncharacterized protein YbjQ (UPF0145 family)
MTLPAGILTGFKMQWIVLCRGKYRDHVQAINCIRNVFQENTSCSNCEALSINTEMVRLVERTEKSGAGAVIGISRPFWNMNQLNEALDHAIDKLARSRLGQHEARQMTQRLQKDNQHQGSRSAVCTNN